MNDIPAVCISDLTLCFGHQEALSHLNTVLPKGQIIGILGPSGAGKTTLVRSLLGTLPFAAGEVSVMGSPVPSFAALRQIGYMAQNDALYDDLTAMDHLVFYGRLLGLTRKEANSRAGELLAFVGLEQERKKVVHQYSGGMKRRLSLAIALIHRPPLLILDEPTVGIDPLLRQKLWKEFASLRDQGCTIVATTHVMDEAARCDRLLLLREGRILADGTVSELLARAGVASLEDAFLRFSTEKEAV